MAYQQSIITLIDEVLDLPEIRAGLDVSPDYIRRAYVREKLLERSDVIAQEAAPAITSFDTIEKTIRSFESQTGPFFRLTTWALRAGSLLSATALLSATVVTLLARWTPVWHWTTSTPTMLITAIIAMFSGPVILGPALAGLRIRRRLTGELDMLRRDLHSARVATDQAMRVATVQNATQVLNETLDSFYQDTIFVGAATTPEGSRTSIGRGLAEAMKAENEIGTEERKRVMLMIETLPGASIGVAGPRGAGKSTLLWSICGANPSLVGGQAAITVHTSAPVQYDARDFLLHIFSSVCRAVLKAEGELTETRRPRGPELPSAFRTAITELSSFLVIAGGFVGTVGFVFAVFQASWLRDNQLSAPFRQPAIDAMDAVRAAIWSAPSNLIQWGAIASLAGFAAWTYLVSTRLIRRRVRRLFPARKAGSLTRLCREALDDIRFQRSYTSGWSGALKVIPGLEAGVSGAMTLAQQQRTLPEIVERFVDLLNLICNSHDYSRVIIAIDELDKIGSDDDAQRFLNEIKAVFTVPNCFYLISVSESAISSFERRGLPFRDAFDSAFDDIIYVDYLTLAESRRLIARRVLNLPAPFLCLAHVLAAGLPRDLIRVTRTILDYARDNGAQCRLSEVCTSLVAREIRNKLLATAIVAREISLDPEGTQFATWLAKLSETEVSSTAFSMNSWESLPAMRPDMSDGERLLFQKLRSLRDELDAFVSYAMTTIDLFNRISDESEWRAAETNWVDGLAAARQAMELGTGVAKYRIQRLRNQCNLSERALS